MVGPPSVSFSTMLCKTRKSPWSSTASTMHESPSPPSLIRQCSGRMPTVTGVPSAAVIAPLNANGRSMPSMQSASPSTRAARRFMAGEPMNAATKVLAGRS